MDHNWNNCLQKKIQAHSRTRKDQGEADYNVGEYLGGEWWVCHHLVTKSHPLEINLMAIKQPNK